MNSLLELEGAEDDRQAGDAIQLQLAAFTAMGKAGGKGKSFGKPKGKGKGKIVKSNLTIDQRRQKLTELKSKSKCLRCGTIGHWAGDPECKFPGSKTGAPGRPAPKPAAHFADMSDSSDDDGVTLTASPDRDRDAVAMMAVRQAKPSSRPSCCSSIQQQRWLDFPGSRCYNETRGPWVHLSCWTVQGFVFLECVV